MIRNALTGGLIAAVGLLILQQVAVAAVSTDALPSISIDNAEVVQGPPVTVTWNPNGNSQPCYTFLKQGFGGATKPSPFTIDTSKATSLGQNTVTVYCASPTAKGKYNFSDNLRFFVRPATTTPTSPTAPLVGAVQAKAKFGSPLTFNWNAMGGTQCRYYIPAANVYGLIGDDKSTTFSVDSSNFRRAPNLFYGLNVRCVQKNGASLSSDWSFFSLAD